MEKKKVKKKRIKEIKLPMKFNPGTMKYEPVVSLKKNKRKTKIKIKWFWILVIIIALIIILSLIF